MVDPGPKDGGRAATLLERIDDRQPQGRDRDGAAIGENAKAQTPSSGLSPGGVARELGQLQERA
jgi:hypothetical protein